MVKNITLLLSLLTLCSVAEEPSNSLQKNCLKCHSEQKIPSELIYRRYLLTYSSNRAIETKLIKYLKEPKKKNSIMPKQFFLKFPQKEALDLNETTLRESVQAYLEFFDVKKQLKLP